MTQEQREKALEALKKMYNAIGSAEQTFSFYVRSHREKGSPYDKIKRNEDMRDMMAEAYEQFYKVESALTAPPVPTEEQIYDILRDTLEVACAGHCYGGSPSKDSKKEATRQILALLTQGRE